MKSENYRRTGGLRLYVASAVLLLLAGSVPADVPVRMQTDLGAIDLLLFNDLVPETVDNFLGYMNRGDYDRTFIHRSVRDFVIQGGGYRFDGPEGTFFTNTVHIPRQPAIANQFNLSNQRGTLAMAKTLAGPDTATSEWFFNLVDNSSVLDVDNGGYTVFGAVQGDGMEIVDAISALPICPEFAPFFVCFAGVNEAAGIARELPMADKSGQFDNSGLINIYVGSDADGDGAIDRLEDAGPNGGDGNSDLQQDSTEQHVASFPAGDGEYVVVDTGSAAVPLAQLTHRDASFHLATLSPCDIMGRSVAGGMIIPRGYVGFDVTGLVPGAARTVTLTLPAGDAPDTWFNYGPTLAVPAPHWYVFNYDGTTGAEFAGNVVTLHYVDGLRGDADLSENGIVAASPGGTGNQPVLPTEFDGVADDVEDAGPNNGDGNNDLTPDRDQGEVASLPDLNDRYVVVVSSQPEQKLCNVAVLAGDTLGIQSGFPGPEELAGYNFENGFFDLHVVDVPPGGTAEVRLILPDGSAPDTYFMYGPEAANPDDHWYRFDFDAASGTGAVIDGNEVTLYFVDGQRGDNDLSANGIIGDPGAPATAIRNTLQTSGSGGGCSVLPGTSAWQGGAWWLLLGMLVFRAAVRQQRNG